MTHNFDQPVLDRDTNFRGFDFSWLLGITALGLALRIVGLGWESIWYDEASSLDMASAPLAELLGGEKLTPGNPCGYFALQRVWCLMFGFTIESARALSAIAGTATIPVTWLLAFRLTGSREVATLASLLTAFNPALVFLSREARVYALMATVATLATLFAVDVIQRRRRLAWVGLTVCCAALVHLHYYSFFLIAVLGMIIVWGEQQNRWKAVAKLAVAGTIVGLAFLPWLDVFLKQLGWGTERNASTWVSHVLYSPVYAIGGRTFIWKQDGLAWLVVAEALAVFFVLLPIFWQLRRDARAPGVAIAMALGVPLLAVAVSALYSPMFNARYASSALPSLMIVLAYSMSRVAPGGWRLRNLPAAVLAGIMLISLFRLYTGVHKDDWHGLSEYVASHGPHQQVVFYEDVGGLSFAYYRAEQPRTLLLETFDADGRAWDSAGYAELLTEFDDYWVVLWPELTEESLRQVTAWFEGRFETIDDQSFRGLRLLRYSRRNANSQGVWGGTPQPPPGCFPDQQILPQKRG